MKLLLPLSCFLFFLLPHPLPLCADEPAEPGNTPGRVEVVTIPTPGSVAALEVKIPFRVPANYDAERPDMWRVLVVFGGKNTNGFREVEGQKLEFPKWADQEGIFLVCPGFRDDTYWEPEMWSGQALMDTLAEIKKNYNICTDKLLFYGVSLGADCSNLFSAWRPDMARAYVSHGGSRFHKPTRAMRGVAALVTCGDADYGSYEPSREFVNRYHKLGVDVLWKSYHNYGHDPSSEAMALVRAFFSHHHRLHISDLAAVREDARPPANGDIPAARQEPRPPNPFVGDNMDGFVYRADDERVNRILPEDRVELPTEAIARAWGTPQWAEVVETRTPARVEVRAPAPAPVIRPAPVIIEEPNHPLLIHEDVEEEEEVVPVRGVPGFQ